MVQLPLAGGCMCGALRYEVSAPPLMVYNCHCTNCQKIGGTAFNTSGDRHRGVRCGSQRASPRGWSGRRTAVDAVRLVLRRSAGAGS